MFNNYTAYLVRDNISPTTLSWNDVGKNDILVICRKSADKFICPMEDPIVLNNMDVNMQGYAISERKKVARSKMPILRAHGSKILVGHLHDEINPTTYLSLSKCYRHV
ncbi:hypothetical protein CsatB_001646 [Cannabis sativa]